MAGVGRERAIREGWILITQTMRADSRGAVKFSRAPLRVIQRLFRVAAARLSAQNRRRVPECAAHTRNSRAVKRP